MNKTLAVLLLGLLVACVSPLSAQKKKITGIEGIGPAYAAKLEQAGIKTQGDLLAAGGTRTGREQLATRTGISSVLLLKWVNRADLARVKGIGTQYADLLEAAGVDSPRELARRNPANLLAALKKANEEKKLVRQLPTQTQVESWIKAAKELKSPVEG
jgi:predicted flap endonuclease-1-like 5' DNA nuclease